MQLVILYSKVIIDCFKDSDVGIENFLILKSGDEKFISTESEDANSSENNEGNEGNSGLRY